MLDAVRLAEASTTQTPSVFIRSYINASGTIVGSMGTIGGSACLRQPSGQVIPIPTDALLSEATGINVAGTVIVNLNPDNFDTTPTAATYNTANGLRNLNALIPAGSGWQLQFATGINDKGQIVGFGQIPGTMHGFLLNPVLSGT